MSINVGDPIDEGSINDIYAQLDRFKDKLVNLMYRNAKGANDKTIRSLDGKRLQILAGVVPVQDQTSKNDETSIQVKFYNAFGGSKDPMVVAMPESGSPYGVSIKNIDQKGFTLVIRQFPNSPKDNTLNLTSIHYIAVGLP